jgi:hypothetical protein
MKFAQVMLMDETGTEIWCGTLRQFARDNGMDRRDVAMTIEAFRFPVRTHGRPEPVSFGGGASPEFDLHLVT